MRKPPLPQARASLETAEFPVMDMGIMVMNGGGGGWESQTTPVSAGFHNRPPASSRAGRQDARHPS